MVALTAALVVPAAATAQEPGPTAPAPNAERPLSQSELLDVRGEHPKWALRPTTLVADVTIERDTPMRKPVCRADQPKVRKCALGTLSRGGRYPGEPVVIVRRQERDQIDLDGEFTERDRLAFIRARDTLRLIGRVASPAGSYLTPIDPEAVATASELPAGSMIVVRGWLSRLRATGTCPKVPRELDGRRDGWDSPFVRCPGGWLTTDPITETDPGDALVPAGYGIPVQFGALERVGVYRGPLSVDGTFLLERVGNPITGMQPRLGWKVIARLHATEGIPLPPPRSLDEADRPLGLDWQPVVGRQPPADSREIHTTAWAGGFASVHRGVDRVMSSWVSPDGSAWQSAELPTEIRNVETLLHLGDGLVLVANHRLGAGWSSFEVWRSTDGLSWDRAAKQRLRTPDGLTQHSRLFLGFWSLGDRIVTYQVYTRRLLTSADPDHAAVGATATPFEVTYVWTTSDGRRWKRHVVERRMRPVDARSGKFFEGDDELLLRHTRDECQVSRSLDGIQWERIENCPDIVTNAPYALTRVGRDLILAGESSPSEGEHPLIGNYLVIWRTDGDGGWQRVFEGPNRMPTSIVASGSTVVLDGEVMLPDQDGEYEFAPFLLASTDEGWTWDQIAEWTDDEAWCLDSLTAKDGTVLLDAACAPPSAATKYVIHPRGVTAAHGSKSRP